MTCQRLNEKLDDFVDGTLDARNRLALQEHVADCTECRSMVDGEHRLRALLKELGDSDMPVADSDFLDLAVARAAHAGSRRERHRYWLKGFGSAIAAGLALFAITLMFLGSPEQQNPGPGIPAVTMALEEPRTVNLVFASASELVDATLTVVLPDGIDVAGFEGQREISWVTTLTAGRNVLPLKLIASSPRGGELLATLQHADDDRTFRLRVDVI